LRDSNSSSSTDRPIFAATLLLLVLASCAWPVHADDNTCVFLSQANFRSIQDASTQIILSRPIPATESEPAHCLASGYVEPNIGIQLRLPAAWNGKLLKLGCAGHCGMAGDDYLPMKCAAGLRKGYACLTSDMGHSGLILDGMWGQGNLQAKVDWGYRATHVATVAAKEIVRHYYGSAAKKSYFVGCSTGGRQGLQEAQRFPWDFDGIVAGAPPVKLSNIYMTLAWGMRSTHDANGKPLLSTANLQLLHQAAVRKCDLDDGVKDGVISDPFRCGFDPAELACSKDHSEGCLAPSQVEAAKKVYAGPATSSGQALTLGGPMIGSEFDGWQTFVGAGDAPPTYDQLTRDGLRYLFFATDPGANWQPSDFDFDRDYQRLDLLQSLYASNDVDLRRFKKAGGKLLVFHGLADEAVIARDSVEYYETVERVMGGRAETQDFFRLFLLPGVGHCSGGPGADTVDYLSAIEDWVESNRPPERLIASRMKTFDRARPFWTHVEGDIEFTRPLHPYPSKALFKGKGDWKDAANFKRVPAAP